MNKKFTKGKGFIKSFAIGFTEAFILLFLFYKSIILSFVLGILYGIVNIKLSEKKMLKNGVGK